MTDDEDLVPQSAAWCERLARQQRGYFYDWRSVLEPGNGEDLYTKLVEQELGPAMDVVDAGCGHGQDALRIAPRVRSVVGYDRTQAFIEIAEAERRAHGIDNARFICADSKPSGMPLPANSIDLFLSRRGPRNWIADAGRVSRPDAVMLMLSPISGEDPAWNDELPEKLRFPRRAEELPTDLEPTRADIASRLARIGAKLTDEWYCEVDELFSEPRELYHFRTWGREPTLVPGYEQSASALERIFERHAGGGHLRIKHRRWLWRAVAWRCCGHERASLRARGPQAATADCSACRAPARREGRSVRAASRLCAASYAAPRCSASKRGVRVPSDSW